MFQNVKNCTKNLHISNKSRTFAEVFIFELDFMLWSDALRSDCVGCFLYIWLKRLSILRKINFFFEKKVEKICTYQKKAVPLHRLTNKTITTMKKQIFNRIFWAFVALGLCTLVCVQWLRTGCGWQSLVMASAFYCALCFGGYVFVDDILKERR